MTLLVGFKTRLKPWLLVGRKKKKDYVNPIQIWSITISIRKWHIKVNCSKLEEKKENVKSLDATDITEKDLNVDIIMFVTIGDDRFQDIWVLDSGCLYHVFQ